MKNLKKLIIFIVIISIIISNIIPVVSAIENDEIKITVDGDYISFDVAPFIENGRTYVPFRAIFESFGMEVTYNDATAKAKIREKYGNSFYVPDITAVYKVIDEKVFILKYEIDLAEKTMSVYLNNNSSEYVAIINKISINVQLVKDRTFVPARLIAESFGAEVTWEEKTRTVIIDTTKAEVTDQNGDKIPIDRTRLIEAKEERKSAPFKETENEIVKLFNEARVSGGMSALTQNETLTKLARMKAEEMAENKSDKLEFSDGIKKFLKNNNAESKAQCYYVTNGKKSDSEVVDGWKKHVNFNHDLWAVDKMTQIGVGAAKAENGDIYYVCINVNPFGEEEKTALENEVIRLVNVEREKAGLSPVTQNNDLMKVARMKADDMSEKGYCDHESPTYGSPQNMVEKHTTEIKYLGENITAGQSTAADAVTAWLISPAHKNILLKDTANIVGIGVALNEKGDFMWSLIMGKK